MYGVAGIVRRSTAGTTDFFVFGFDFDFRLFCLILRTMRGENSAASLNDLVFNWPWLSPQNLVLGSRTDMLCLVEALQAQDRRGWSLDRDGVEFRDITWHDLNSTDHDDMEDALTGINDFSEEEYRILAEAWTEGDEQKTRSWSMGTLLFYVTGRPQQQVFHVEISGASYEEAIGHRACHKDQWYQSTTVEVPGVVDDDNEQSPWSSSTDN